LARLKLDTELFLISSLVEKMIKVNIKDCFKDEDSYYFIVGTGWLGKAIGKGGLNVKKVQEKLKKKIKFIEYRDSSVDFVKNVIYPLKVEQVYEESGVLVLKDSSRKVKGQLIGHAGKNLEFIKRAVSRFFDVNVKVE
jgi:transcription termination/antitermination protein NusA